jgi:UDP-N-acetylglucosamine--N-acetylmuramyl-(pentapeptide) pyrophosphoryl-undecaprenol N-acetylglucosamine transferase
MQRKSKNENILLAASGTKGHIYPAIEVAKKLKEKNFNIIFAAKDLKKNPFLKKEVIEFLNIKTFDVDSVNILNLKNMFRIFKFLKDLKILIKGVFSAIKILREYNIKTVIGFGSYHTLSVMIAAKILNKKIYLFEPNLILGRMHRLFSFSAKGIFHQFPYKTSKKKYFLLKTLPWSIKEKKITKEQGEKAKEFFGLNRKKFTILVFGGSQGSKIINKNFLSSVLLLKQNKFLENIQFIHLLGNSENINDFEEVYSKHLGDENKYICKKFADDMENYYLASDLVISRSGASTIQELLFYEKPSILIPLKNSIKNHQQLNANYLKNTIKCSDVILEKDLNSFSLYEKIKKFQSSEILKNLLNLYIKNIQNHKNENFYKRYDLTKIIQNQD